jgi:hypothetical protein
LLSVIKAKSYPSEIDMAFPRAGKELEVPPTVAQRMIPIKDERAKGILLFCGMVMFGA